jgi:endoglucanase
MGWKMQNLERLKFIKNWLERYLVLLVLTLGSPAFASVTTVSATASPSTVAAGQTVTFTAAIQSTTALSNVNVDLEFRTPSNSTIVGSPQKTFVGINFTAGQTNTYQWTYTIPANLRPGTYCLISAVFNSSWTAVDLWQICPVRVVVTPPLAVTAGATSAQPTSVQPGQTIQFSAAVSTNIAASGLNIDLEVRDPYSNPIASTPQQKTFQNISFTAGQTQTYTWSYQVPQSLAAGTYCLVTAAFNSSWSGTLLWKNCSAEFKVVVPPLTLSLASAAAQPSAAVAGQTVSLSAGLQSNVAASGVGVTLSVLNTSGVAISGSPALAFNSQTFTAGKPSTFTYPYAIPSTLSPGTYCLAVSAVSSSNQPVLSNKCASQFTVAAPPATTLAFSVAGATASPIILGPGATTKFAASVASNVNVSGVNIDLEVRDTSNNQIVGNPQLVFSNQNFVGGAANSYSWSYTVPPTLATGVYCLVVAAFNSTWTQTEMWQSCTVELVVMNLTTTPTAIGHLSLPGVNISGAEFNAGRTVCASVVQREAATGCVLEGWDYIYPSNAEIDYYASKGLKVIRLPFDGNRIQPLRDGPLSTSELAFMDPVVQYATSKGLIVLLDPHNYGYLNDNSGVSREIGVDPLMPASYFGDLWSKLATHYIGNANVMFGLMNEPNVQTPQQWHDAAIVAIQAIRATGAKQKILIPGTFWTGAESWMDGNSAVWTGFTDINFAFEVHQYLDSNNSGTSATCVTGKGSTILAPFTAWARANKVEGFLGESGWATNMGCMAEGDAIVSYMNENSDVWLGYTYWAGGLWLGSYMYSIEPAGLGTSHVIDQLQMSILTYHN